MVDEFAQRKIESAVDCLGLADRTHARGDQIDAAWAIYRGGVAEQVHSAVDCVEHQANDTVSRDGGGCDLAHGRDNG